MVGAGIWCRSQTARTRHSSSALLTCTNGKILFCMYDNNAYDNDDDSLLKVNKKQQQQRIVANRPGIMTLNSRNATISQMILELLERWYSVTLQIPPLREERQMTNLYTVIRCFLVGRTLSEGER